MGAFGGLYEGEFDRFYVHLFLSLLISVDSFNQVIAKLGFNRAVHHMYRQLEYDVIEGFNHLAGSELAKVSSLFG